MKHTIKNLMTYLLMMTLLLGVGCGYNVSFKVYAAESTFYFDGTNADEYNDESTIVFSMQTVDLNDMQVADLITKCKQNTDFNKVVFESNVRLIGERVFEECYSLETVDFSKAKNLKVIENFAFAGCTSLAVSVYKTGNTYVTTTRSDGMMYLPDNLSYFGEGCFQDTGVLCYVISSDNTAFSTNGGILFNKTQNSIIGFPPARSGSYAIPDTVSSIHRYAFEGSAITKLTVPSSLTSIGTKAFYNSLLRTVVFDDNNNITIGSGAFYQDPEKEEFMNIASETWQGISQVKITEETYNNSIAFIENTDDTACFTPYSLVSYNGNEEYEAGCDLYVVPTVTVSGVPSSWVASTNLNFYWNNTDYTTIVALYLDNEQVTFEEGSTASDAISVKKNGNYNLTVKYRNKNGNTASVSKEIVISKVDPEVPAEVTYTLVDDVCYLHSYDTDSGLDQIKYILNNGDQTTYANGFTLTPGTNTVTCWATDKVGNTNSSKVYTIVVPGEARAVNFDCTAKQLLKGDSFTIKASFVPSTVTNQTLVWSTSDESIATVNEKGEVTGVRVGYAVITATSASGYSAKCAVVVTKDPAVKSKLTMYKDSTVKLTVENKRSDFDITYSSDDKKVCKIDKNGKITAIKAGEATIVTKVDTGVRVYSLKTVVTVKQPKVSIIKKTSSLKVGKSFRFRAYREGLKKKIKWKSSNSLVASVNKTTGKVIAQGKGVAYITATCGKYKDTYKITIK